MAFDASADQGRGALAPRRVTRLYRNTTSEWIRLRWTEEGEEKELVTTPGHNFLDEFGKFPTIAEMTSTGSATVVLASGALVEVAAERIVYSAGTEHMFERAQVQGVVAGNAALKPVEMDAWQTYNFEVEDLHTYVAGGVRVHNDSGLLGQIGSAINNFVDDKLQFTDNGFGDAVTDFVTAPLHLVGTVLNGITSGIASVARSLNSVETNAFWDDPLNHLHTPAHDRFVSETMGLVGMGALPKGQTIIPNGGGFRLVNDTTILDKYSQAQSGGNNLNTTGSKTLVNASGGNGGGQKSSVGTGNFMKDLKDFAHSVGQALGIVKPIILDLNGNGTQISDLSKSTQFAIGDDGLQHRSAWAAAGDGVLFYDADGDGKISDKREYVFTEWAPGAQDDMEAMRKAFDTNGDGKTVLPPRLFTRPQPHGTGLRQAQAPPAQGRRTQQRSRLAQNWITPRPVQPKGM